MTQPFDRLNGAMVVKEIRQDTFAVMLSLHVGSFGRAKTIVGIQNVDIVLRVVGVPDEARARVIDEVKARRVGNTGRVQLCDNDLLRRLGLM